MSWFAGSAKVAERLRHAGLIGLSIAAVLLVGLTSRAESARARASGSGAGGGGMMAPAGKDSSNVQGATSVPEFLLSGYQARIMTQQLRRLSETDRSVKVESGAGSTFVSTRDISCRESEGERNVPSAFSCKIRIQTGPAPAPCTQPGAAR